MVRQYREKATAEQARALYVYDPVTGLMTNRVAHGKAKAGDVAGSLRADGYRIVRVAGCAYLAHRVAWLIHYGAWPVRHLDHKDRNPRNNAIENLRECNDAENAQNLSRAGYGTSGYLGVTRYFRDTNRWVAKIKKNQKAVSLGIYRCKTAAYVAYCTAKKQTHEFVAADMGGRN